MNKFFLFTRSCFVPCLILSTILSGCDKVSLNPRPSKRVFQYGQKIPKGGGSYKVGKPYTIAGRVYYPKEDPNYQEFGIASWYGDDFHGRYTANGEIFDMDALSAAHPTMPMPSYARVTNIKNGKSIVVRINDRGPYAHGRVLDVSRRAAEFLEFRHTGTAHVEVAYLSPAPLSGEDGWVLDSSDVQESKESQSDPTESTLPYIRAPEIDKHENGNEDEREIAVLDSSEVQEMYEYQDKDEGLLYIQIGSFRDLDNANRVTDHLNSMGYQAEMTPINVAGELYYRVRLGPIIDYDQAQEALRIAQSNGTPEAYLILSTTD